MLKPDVTVSYVGQKLPIQVLWEEEHYLLYRITFVTKSGKTCLENWRSESIPVKVSRMKKNDSNKTQPF